MGSKKRRERRQQRPAPGQPPQIPSEHRFTSTYYSEEVCRLALEGKEVPPALGNPVVLACTVRGIRQHIGFATELHGALPVLTRALNARQIMSNRIPDMPNHDDLPYCFWHPDVAQESTYRELAQRYPHLRYNVGRACAVAGYTELYRELQLLPDTHIAEEAQDNGNTAILDDITANRQLFSIMDDYTRTASVTQASLTTPVRLNGDTAVRSTLDNTRRIEKHPRWLGPVQHCYFNITEDFCVDIESRLSLGSASATALAVTYLYTPLPYDLPPFQKDLLILLAAYHGDIDRYSRLRRPGVVLPKEQSCVIRGIYYNTFFSKWWSHQLSSSSIVLLDRLYVAKAVLARAIMDNDLTSVTTGTPHTFAPYCIWHPNVPQASTLKMLASLRPDMVQQISRACIVAGYVDLYDELDPAPTADLFAEAKDSVDTRFTEHLRRKSSADRHPTVSDTTHIQDWKMISYRPVELSKQTTSDLVRSLGVGSVVSDFDGILDGVSVDISEVNLHISAIGGLSTASSTIARSSLQSAIDQQLREYGTAHLDMIYSEQALIRPINGSGMVQLDK